MFASAFDSATADEVTELAKVGIIHALLVVGEIRDRILHGLCASRDGSEQLAIVDQGFNLAFPKLRASLIKPGVILGGIFAKGSLSDGG